MAVSKMFARFKNNLDKIKSSAKEGGIETFDDGRYQARLTKIEIAPSPNNKKRMVASYFWTFVNGDYAGKKHRSFQGWEDEEQLGYFLKDLVALGYDVDEFEDLDTDIPAVQKEIAKEKPVAQIQLKTNKDDYQNVRILKVLDPDDVEIEIDEDEEDEKPAKGKKPAAKKASSKKAKDEEEDEEEVEDEEDEEEAEDDDEDEIPATSKKGGKKPAAKPATKKSKAKDEDDEEEVVEDDEEAEEEEAEEEVLELEPGCIVKAKTKAGVKKATIVSLDEAAQKAVIELADGKKLKVAFDAVLSVEQAAPKAKGKSKK